MRARLARSLSLARLALCGVAALASTGAHAGRPMTTEDAGVLPAGSCELETYHARLRDDSPTVRTESLQWGCGATGSTQLALQLQNSHGAGSSLQWAVVGKTRLTADDASLHAAVAWRADAHDDPGKRLRLGGATLLGVITWPVNDSLQAHANLGWIGDHIARQQSTVWSLALEKSLDARWDVMAESFGSDRQQHPWWQLGLRWAAMPERLWLDTSFGRPWGAGQSRALSVGLRAAF